jgi:hypothetical protein
MTFGNASTVAGCMQVIRRGILAQPLALDLPFEPVANAPKERPSTVRMAACAPPSAVLERTFGAFAGRSERAS